MTRWLIATFATAALTALFFVVLAVSYDPPCHELKVNTHQITLIEADNRRIYKCVR